MRGMKSGNPHFSQRQGEAGTASQCPREIPRTAGESAAPRDDASREAEGPAEASPKIDSSCKIREKWGTRFEMTMTDAELIQRFESDTLPGDFHHADHVRLAFAYLSVYPALQALERFANALKRYAGARGKAELYHETITHAYFFLIRERMARCGAANWDDFARRNPDLLIWKGGILTRYYHESTLQCDLARAVFLFPDKYC